MSAKPHRESVDQRLESFRTILSRQDDEWRRMRGEIEAAGDVRLVVDALPEIAPCENLILFVNATRA